MPEISSERRAELERLALAALSEDDWAKDRGPERATPAREGQPAQVWYDDGDLCADVHDNMGMGLNGDTLAAFWAKATPLVLLALLRDLREVEGERDAAREDGENLRALAQSVIAIVDRDQEDINRLREAVAAPSPGASPPTRR